MKTWVLFVGQFRLSFLQMKRYAFDTVSGMVTLFVLFLLLFYGANAALPSGPGKVDTLEHILVTYLVWMVAVFAYETTGQQLGQEAQMGTLEQLAMSPLGLPVVLMMRFLGGLTLQFGLLLGMLVMMMASTGRWLNLDLPSVLPLMLLTTLGVQGLGLMMGGLAVVYKRIGQLLNIINFLFIAIIAAPLSQFPYVKHLPLAWGNHLINRVIVDGVSLLEIPMADTALLAANSVAWLLVGYGVFKLFEAKARREGKLAHY